MRTEGGHWGQIFTGCCPKPIFEDFLKQQREDRFKSREIADLFPGPNFASIAISIWATGCLSLA
jgi:hypothetical protein